MDNLAAGWFTYQAKNAIYMFDSQGKWEVLTSKNDSLIGEGIYELNAQSLKLRTKEGDEEHIYNIIKEENNQIELIDNKDNLSLLL